MLGPRDRLLVGTDLVKDRSSLEAAYNDSAGVTAEFNRNMLRVINAQPAAATSTPTCFEHVAFYNEPESRIEMWLRAREDMSARIDALGMDVGFQRGRGDAHGDPRASSRATRWSASTGGRASS